MRTILSRWTVAVTNPYAIEQAPPYGSNSLSPQYGGGQTVGSSPQAAASPHLTASPQVPSPQGQTLDLSVNRLHRYTVLVLITSNENTIWIASFRRRVVQCARYFL